MRPILIFCTGLVLLAGCETVEGMGQDVQSAGKAISNEAQNPRNEVRTTP
ncbi:MAG: entericidin A/B family lipoprotein [Rhodobacteraceae bacterium]|nr:entericidin A/B family lipoprotein [Paracoccaceae bacterium]